MVCSLENKTHTYMLSLFSISFDWSIGFHEIVDMAHGGGVNMHVYVWENGFLNSASQYDLETQPLKPALRHKRNFIISPALPRA